MRPPWPSQGWDGDTPFWRWRRRGAAANTKLEFNTFLEGDEQLHLFTTYPSENVGPCRHSVIHVTAWERRRRKEFYLGCQVERRKETPQNKHSNVLLSCLRSGAIQVSAVQVPFRRNIRSGQAAEGRVEACERRPRGWSRRRCSSATRLSCVFWLKTWDYFDSIRDILCLLCYATLCYATLARTLLVWNCHRKFIDLY